DAGEAAEHVPRVAAEPLAGAADQAVAGLRVAGPQPAEELGRFSAGCGHRRGLDASRRREARLPAKLSPHQKITSQANEKQTRLRKNSLLSHKRPGEHKKRTDVRCGAKEVTQRPRAGKRAATWYIAPCITPRIRHREGTDRGPPMRIEVAGTITLDDWRRAFATPAGKLPTVSEPKPFGWKAKVSWLISLLVFAGITWMSVSTVLRSGWRKGGPLCLLPSVIVVALLPPTAIGLLRYAW